MFTGCRRKRSFKYRLVGTPVVHGQFIRIVALPPSSSSSSFTTANNSSNKHRSHRHYYQQAHHHHRSRREKLGYLHHSQHNDNTKNHNGNTSNGGSQTFLDVNSCRSISTTGEFWLPKYHLVPSPVPLGKTRTKSRSTADLSCCLKPKTDSHGRLRPRNLKPFAFVPISPVSISPLYVPGNRNCRPHNSVDPYSPMTRLQYTPDQGGGHQQDGGRLSYYNSLHLHNNNNNSSSNHIYTQQHPALTASSSSSSLKNKIFITNAHKQSLNVTTPTNPDNLDSPSTSTTTIATTINNNNNNENNDDAKNNNLNNNNNNNHHHHHHLSSSFSVGNIAAMSLRETPGRHNIPVSRSQSFGGLSVRSTGSMGPTTPVLGDTFKRSSGTRSYAKAQGTLSRSGRKAVAIKVPKVPRPGRAMMVFDSVKKGIGSFIQATHEDIAELMAGDLSTSTSQQIKAAERYLKRLEFHLAKIDELHDCYMLNQQLREGARNMARAYNSTSTVSRKDNIASVKYGYKECSQTMCAIEAQLENMLGTFSCRLKGIVGFARLCPGDVFEVVIKHGNQKWKTKGRIDKNNTQRWDCPEFTFKCLVGDVFSIKASEVRAFKTVLLGQKNCEVCHSPNPESGSQGLFSSHPQLMTVSVNLNGSLKLSIVITWNPMDAMDESVVFYEPPSRPPGSTKRRPMSVINASTASFFDSNSDLSSIPDRRLSSPLQGFRLGGDDSGIYGSATSLPSRNFMMMSSSFHQHQHPHSLSASPISHALGNNANVSALTPEMRRLHSAYNYRNSMSHDTRSVQSQPVQATSSSSTDHLPSSSQFNNHHNARPHSSYISTAAYNNLPGSGAGGSARDAGGNTKSGGGGDGSSDQLSTSNSSNMYLDQNTLSTPPVQPIPEISQAMIPGVMVQGEMTRHDSSITVEEALGSVMTTLEDFLGQYQELQKLEEILPAIERFIRNSSSPSSRSSSMSVSIDCAIEEAFDFLNTEDTLEEVDEEEEEDDKQEEEEEEEDKDGIFKNSAVSKTMDKLSSPDSTAKTGDSGIELLAKRLQEDNQMGSSMGSSPVPPSTGNEQVDMALLFHLGYCDTLLENLGNYGPLKCREFYALDLLQKQADILEKLLDLAKAGPSVDLHSVLAGLTTDKTLKEFWALCVDQTSLYVTPEKVLAVMDTKFGQKIAEHFDIKPVRVFHYLMARILNIPTYQPDPHPSSDSPHHHHHHHHPRGSTILTLHQFVGYFKQDQGLALMEKLAQDLRIMDRLTATASDTVIKCILTLREELPAPPCLKLIARLLVGPSKEMFQSAASYLKVIHRDKAKRDKAMVVLVEGLEDHLADVRAGCCTALSIIEAEESIDQLVHVSQIDSSSTVRRKAKEALYSLGEAGRRAMESAQLGSQGFQGLQMRKF